jgi:hypothetical protein
MMDKGQGQKWTGWTRWTRMDYGRDKGQGTRDMGQGTSNPSVFSAFYYYRPKSSFCKRFSKKTMRKLLALKIFLIFEKVFEPPGRFHSFSWTVAKTGNERLIGDVGISPERA